MTLAIHGGIPVANTPLSFDWPRVTDEVREAVLAQLDVSLSIYDRSGIFERFETDFAALHGVEHGLLFNSGTSALFSIYEAAGLRDGAEVLCPVYTFHATASPLAYLGCRVVFCDSDRQGNMSLDAIASRRTERTKAVVVTHMWGMPAEEMSAIANYCDREGLLLIEDCSHAHGALVDGRPVGSFGTAAAWSLQGQKILTGGEGGIALTNDKELYYRALLHGHYNKRPKMELPSDHILREYFLTGMGLKLRAHPLAIAIASQQLSRLPEFLDAKRVHASILIEALAGYDFLEVVSPSANVSPSWYALTVLFDESTAGVSRKRFVDALVAEGLAEADIPGSTGLLYREPLFRDPEPLLGRGTPQPLSEAFPHARDYYDRMFKLPVWAFSDEVDIVRAYAEGIAKVATYVAQNRSL